MISMLRAIVIVPIFIGLSGCLSTIGTVVTAPVKIASKTADWATTSQDEADRNRGRKTRRAEEAARRACRSEPSDMARETCVRGRLTEQGFY